MTEPLYAVYGANGCGRGVMPLARAQVNAYGLSGERLVFIDDDPDTPVMVNGHRVLTYSAFTATSASEHWATFAIAASAVRERLARRAAADGVRAWSIFAANAVIMDDVEIGEGAIFCPFTTVTSNVRIGRHFQANLYSYVEHDCVIGDFVTFAPGVKCNGNIVIDDHAYIGAGAAIRQGQRGSPLVVGRGAVIGMGAVVVHDVPAGTTVVGNPARSATKRTSGRE